MARRGRYMQFLILVLLLLFEGIAIPKLQNDAAYFSLGPELIKGNTFRSHELTTDLIQAMRKSEEPARIAGVYLLEQQFHPGQGDVKHVPQLFGISNPHNQSRKSKLFCF